MSTALTNPLVTVTLQLSVTVPVLVDFNAHWLTQTIGNPVSLLVAVAAGDTAITVNQLAGTSIQPGFSGSTPSAAITIGSLLVANGEVMTVTAIAPAVAPATGYVLTVLRGPVQGALTVPLISAVAHSIGESVAILKYASPWEMTRVEALLPYAQKLVQQAGLTSAVFLSSASGSITAG